MDFNGRMSTARPGPGSSQNRRQEEIDAFMIVRPFKLLYLNINMSTNNFAARYRNHNLHHRNWPPLHPR